MQQRSLDLSEIQRIRTDQIRARIRKLEKALQELGTEPKSKGKSKKK